MDLPSLLRALAEPSAYPFPVAEVVVCQTHISAVFLAGPFAYKVKKPVNPGFLDFSTLENRHHFCEEEVRLNRRLAPDIYLGVVPVVRDGGRLRVEGAGEPVEWAVKMRRLPEGVTLHERLRRDEVGTALVEALARKIADFHHRSPAPDAFRAQSRFDVVAGNIREVFATAAPSVGTAVSAAVYGRVRELVEEQLARQRPLIDGRAARGLTRDAHGDLHLDHVCYFPDRAPPDDIICIDCIEFNERFRFIDPVADMAFAAMDLAFHGRRDLAGAFAEAYFAAAGDDEGRALLPLFAAYRASVRGAEHAAALQSARGHWLLALAGLEEPARRPALLLVGGLQGSGKSTLSRAVAQRADFTHIRSDEVRKELAGVAPDRRLDEAFYSPEWTERTYAECLRRAGERLFEGGRVLIDATFADEERRRLCLGAAARWGVPALWLLCRAEPEVVRRRLGQRRGDVSDADWDVYLRAAARWQEPGSATRRAMAVVPTDDSPDQALRRGERALREAGLA